MCFIATMTRPLRSKRAMTSPVRPRSNASGLTRISVRSMAAGRLGTVTAGARRALDGCALGCVARARRGPRLTRRHRSGRRRGGAARPPSRRLAGLAHLGLAVRADLPARVERLAADGARLLQPPQAARAAEERLLDLEAAVLAVLMLDVGEPRLRGRDLELPLAHVVEVLRRAHDQVDDRPDEREQRRRRGARDQHRIGDPAVSVAPRPVDEREPDHHEEQQQQVDRKVQPAVFDAEQGDGAH